MTRIELMDYLVNEAEYSWKSVERMSDRELFDTYLRWNGLIGWTDDILKVLKCCPDLIAELASEVLPECE